MSSAAFDSAGDVANAVVTGKRSAIEVITTTLARIEQLDKRLNAFTAVTADRARARAEAIDAAAASGKAIGPLAGVPFAVKNLIDIAELSTLAGSRINRDYPAAAADATLVTRLEAAGAILVGALNMGEYAYDFTGENCHYGPSRNPHHLARMTGGSSGGSGGAVTGGLVPVALGSDTNGSIRVPSSFCGVFGLKPTYGRLSRAGSFPFVSSLDHLGPLARNTKDLATVYDAMQGPDPHDPACAHRPAEPVTPLLGLGIAGLRVAKAGGYFRAGAAAEALAALDTVAAALGAAAREIEIPEAARARAAAYVITTSEGAALHLNRLRERAEDFDPDVRDRLIAGALVPGSAVVKAQKFRRWFRTAVLRLFDEVDAILTPATPCVAPLIGQRTLVLDGKEILLRPNIGIYTQPISFVGLPVAVVPIPGIPGLPIGVQIIAAPWREDIALRISHHLEVAGVVARHLRPVDAGRQLEDWRIVAAHLSMSDVGWTPFPSRPLRLYQDSVTALPAALTIEVLHASYAAGLEPCEVIAEVYRRIAAVDDPGIFIALAPEADTLAAARALCRFDAQAKPLWGVPFAIKDNIDFAGLPTTAGCPEFAYRPAASAPAVARLVAAGAIPIGKTNLDQFATGLVGTRTPYQVPRNPFDPGIVPGGSSSGSAVSVSRGIVPFALGTDTAGSGRVPAGLNNIVGLKPTKGAISTRGVVPACRTLDCVSVFALTVGDAMTVYGAMAGFDPEDPYSRPVMPRGPSVTRAAGLRVGVPDFASRIFAGDELAQKAFDASVDDLAALGVAPAKIDLAPFFGVGKLLYEGPWVAERYHAVGNFIEQCPDAVHPVVRQIISAAVGLSAVDAFAGLYRLAELRRAAEAAWESVDVLLVPTLPRPRRVADVEADPIGSNSELGTYTNFVNLLDLCALAVPGRFRGDGLPSGVTLIAPARCEDRISAIGAALHARGAVPLGRIGPAHCRATLRPTSKRRPEPSHPE